MISDTGPRARQPDARGRVTTADGVGLPWEVHGSGPVTLVFLPANPISHSRLWKAQVHPLARRHRVVLFDGRGNGEADAVDPTAEWPVGKYCDDCLAVLDATGTQAAVLVGICGDGVWPSLRLAAAHPERVLGIVAIGTGVRHLGAVPPRRRRSLETFGDVLEDPQGWEKFNEHYIRADHQGFLEFFFREMFPEPHSEKQIEDAVAYGLDGDVESLLMDQPDDVETRESAEAIIRGVRCPVLVVHGTEDNCQGTDRASALVGLTGAEELWLEGAGHIPQARHPVLVNRAIDGFAQRVGRSNRPPRRWRHPAKRNRRALIVSSPIGLGHAWRDVAIARELRRRVPGLEMHWLAQPPVTTLLEACGETIHPASRELASEAAGVDAETGEHELHAFQMLRRLDEIFVANFMVFDDVVREEPFDVWIADEAWEIDYFLHENPELKRAPYVWLSDFVGVVPMAAGGEREALLAADWNAQMVEHVARYPRLRDLSIFIGDPDDVVDEPLGPGLPSIQDWTREHFAFAGYVAEADGEAERVELGYGEDETVCVVTAGGSAAGLHLLERVVAALPAMRERIANLHMVVVAGPRIDPVILPAHEGLEVHAYVHRLQRHLAVCDIAISHGGLSTTMELTAARRPFIYFPLRNHFEQTVHVRHRLARYGAGRCMDFETAEPEEIAAAAAEEMGRQIDYRPVAPGGAARAASLIAKVL